MVPDTTAWMQAGECGSEIGYSSQVIALLYSAQHCVTAVHKMTNRQSMINVWTHSQKTWTDRLKG